MLKYDDIQEWWRNIIEVQKNLGWQKYVIHGKSDSTNEDDKCDKIEIRTI